jgi:hypothetical protein
VIVPSSTTRRCALMFLAMIGVSLGAVCVPYADARGFHFGRVPHWGSGGTPVVGLTQAERSAFEAIDRDDADAVTEYLRRNGNPHVKNERDETLLEAAAFQGHWRALQTMLRYPVPISADEVDAALLAAKKGRQEGRDTNRVLELLKSQVEATDTAPAP